MEPYGILQAESAGGSCLVQRQPGHEILNSESWEASEIGSGSIGDRVYKAVQKHVNLIGRFQVTSFDSSVKENGSKAEQLLFDFYHEHKEQECFDRICKMFGKKYDLAATCILSTIQIVICHCVPLFLIRYSGKLESLWRHPDAAHGKTIRNFSIP